MKTKAEMGIGTLIIFISMILVAAIAAGVLLQTASSLQNKALLTGTKSQAAVATSISPIILAGEDGTTGSLDDFYMKVKLAAGSDPIKLEDVLIEMDLPTTAADLEYKGGALASNCSYGPNGFNTNANGQGNFTVRYLINSTNNREHYLQRGDVIEICFRAPIGIGEDTDFSVSLVPKVGTVTQVQGVTPDVITEKRVVVFP